MATARSCWREAQHTDQRLRRGFHTLGPLLQSGRRERRGRRSHGRADTLQRGAAVFRIYRGAEAPRRGT
jgi:hypothetical protein